MKYTGTAWPVVCVGNLKIGFFDMPASYFYGKCYGEHVCEVAGPCNNF